MFTCLFNKSQLISKITYKLNDSVISGNLRLEKATAVYIFSKLSYPPIALLEQIPSIYIKSLCKEYEIKPRKKKNHWYHHFLQELTLRL